MEDATVTEDGGVEEDVTEVEAEAEAPEVETEETEEADAETAEDGDEEDADEETEEEAETVEYNFGGNKIEFPKDSVPQELQTEIQKFADGTWSDYTKKNQDLSERSKSVEARSSAVDKMQALQGESLETYSQGLRVKSEIEQLSDIDINALWQSDPDQARRVSDTLSAKQAEFQSIIGQVDQQERNLTREQEAEVSRQRAEGEQLMERHIKGFSKIAPEVVDYAVKAGIPKESAGDWALNPIFTKMAHKAMLYDRAQAGVRKKPKTAPASAVPVKAIKGKGASKATKDPDKMSVTEWTKWRESQIKKRA